MSASPAVSVGQRLLVTIERLVFQGSGMGRSPDGRVVFVPYAAPGDLAEVEVTEAREDFMRADLVEVRSPGPGRLSPACRYYGNCGGCQWQHLDYASQLHWKREILLELLGRVGKLNAATWSAPVLPPISPAGPWEYRARAQFKVAAGGRVHIGFHQRESHRVVDIDRCPLLDARLNGALRTLRHMRDPSLAKPFRARGRSGWRWALQRRGGGRPLRAHAGSRRHPAAITAQAVLPTLQVVLLEGDRGSIPASWTGTGMARSWSRWATIASGSTPRPSSR
jgi:tRNA/tmRNA/rRNA uracil-C5-methylase (TrmA/RlmC/RlmD family)